MRAKVVIMERDRAETLDGLLNIHVGIFIKVKIYIHMRVKGSKEFWF